MTVRCPHAVLAAALLLLGCKPEDHKSSDDEENGSCRILCASAKKCGLLSPPLGTDVANCEARCLASSEQLQKAAQDVPDVHDNTSIPEDITADLVDWCSQPTPDCPEVAVRLETTLGTPDVTGASRVVVRLTSGDALKTAPNITPCTVVPDADPQIDTEGSSDASAPAPDPLPSALACETPHTFCGFAGAQQVRFRLRSWDSSETSQTVPCASAVQDAALFHDVPAGPVQASVEIRGNFPTTGTTPTREHGELPILPPEGPSGAYCWTIYGVTTLVDGGASSATDLAIALPPALEILAEAVGRETIPGELYGCESDPDQCSNNRDDDGDGLPDCTDPGCGPLCDPAERTGQACGNGRDDDEDGLPDCEDPGCALFCEMDAQACADGLDNDGDGRVDLEDDSCPQADGSDATSTGGDSDGGSDGTSTSADASEAVSAIDCLDPETCDLCVD